MRSGSKSGRPRQGNGRRRTRKRGRRGANWGDRLVWIGIGVSAGIAVSAAWALAENPASRAVWRALTGGQGHHATVPVQSPKPVSGAAAAALPSEAGDQVSAAARSAINQALAQPLPGSGGVVLPGSVRSMLSAVVGQAVEGGLRAASVATQDGKLRPVSQSGGPGYSVSTFESVRQLSIP